MKSSFLLFLIITLAWTAFRFFVPITNGIDEVVFKPLIFFVPLWYFVKVKEKRDLASLGFSKEHLITNIVLGIGVGIFLIFYSSVIQILKGKPIVFQPGISATFLLTNILISFFTAFTEEVVFRGYMFNRMHEEGADFFTATILSALYFVALHLPRAVFVLHLPAWDIFAYCWLLSSFGVLNAITFWKTKNIAASTTSHSVWNFFVSLTT